MNIDYHNLEKKIGISFKNKDLLIRSLTHKSFDKDNLVGKARFIFFSSDKSIGSIFSFWKWNKSIRFGRFFKKIN